MTTVSGRKAGSLCALLAACVVATMGGQGAEAQTAATAEAKSEAPRPPASAASGVPQVTDECKGSGRAAVCSALRAANLALIAAVKANKEGRYICTSAQHQPRCGATSPQPYLTPVSPSGNPADVAEGRRLLDWYQQNLTCEALCKPKKDAQACEQACRDGKDPATFPPSSGSKRKR